MPPATRRGLEAFVLSDRHWRQLARHLSKVIDRRAIRLTAATAELRGATPDWRKLALELFSRVQRRYPKLAVSLEQRAWEVDQGFRTILGPLPRKAGRGGWGLPLGQLFMAYRGLTRDLRHWNLEQRKAAEALEAETVEARAQREGRADADLVELICFRVRDVVGPKVQSASWPRLIGAVRGHTLRIAVLEILAWATGKSEPYLKGLLFEGRLDRRVDDLSRARVEGAALSSARLRRRGAVPAPPDPESTLPPTAR